MKKLFFLLVLLLTVSFASAQKYQKIAYIDMEYILENVPEYLQAQNTLNAKVAQWKQKLDKQARHIEVLKTDLANQKAILTKDLIEEKEDEIQLKQDELRRLESLYFGPKGDMFLLRKQLVKPIQDQVFNAVQKIASIKKFDFVFDKSSDFVMLYSNKKYDISDLVLSTINRNRKISDKKKAKNKPNPALTAKQKEIQAKKDSAKAKKIAAKEAQKKRIEEKRKAALKKREEKRRILREKKEALKKKRNKKKNN